MITESELSLLESAAAIIAMFAMFWIYLHRNFG